MERLNNERPGSTTIQELCEEYKRNNVITKEEYERHHVKRGLRKLRRHRRDGGLDPCVQCSRLSHRRR